MDSDSLCPICGHERDSEDCCGWCLSCQDETADYDGVLCSICVNDSYTVIDEEPY